MTTKMDTLPRDSRLRRVMICCCAIVRNVAYYNGRWVRGTPIFDSNIERTINGNFMDMAVLEWCKLFGETRHEPQHWQRVILCVDQRREFKAGLVKALGCSNGDWNATRRRCLAYRNDFLAHLGSEPTMLTPMLDPVLKSAAHYYEFIRTTEMPSADPADIHAFYETCSKAGAEYYAARALIR